MSHPSTPSHSHCQNCGAALSGPFCSACGQRDLEFHQSFRAVFHEAVETWFHVDHSFFHGFYTLLFQPGRMTRDVNAGRRARHVPAFRFYLVASLLFFFVFMPHAGDKAEVRTDGEQPILVGEEGKQHRFSPADVRLDLPLSPEGRRRVQESVAEMVDHPWELVESFVHKLPKVLVLLVPVFALFTLLAYGRSRYLYLQHLVLSVHVHTFLLLASVMLDGYAQLLGLVWSGFSTLIAVAGPAYLAWHYYATLHRVFETTRRRALIVGTLLAGVYGLLVFAALLATLAVSLLWH